MNFVEYLGKQLMYRYWAALILSALFTTCLLGPALWQDMRHTIFYLDGFFQNMGMVAAVIVGLSLHVGTRYNGAVLSWWVGLVIGSLSLPSGYAIAAMMAMVGHVLRSSY